MSYKIRKTIIEKYKDNLPKLKYLVFRGRLKEGDFSDEKLKELADSMKGSYTLEDLFLDGKGA